MNRPPGGFLSLVRQGSSIARVVRVDMSCGVNKKRQLAVIEVGIVEFGVSWPSDKLAAIVSFFLLHALVFLVTFPS